MDSKPKRKGAVQPSPAAIEERLETFLHAKLHRYACPPLDQLRDYQLTLLSAAEDAAIADHLTHCPRCTEELTTLTTFLQPASATETATMATKPSLLAQVQEAIEAVRVTIATLVTPLSPAATGVGLRGSAGDEPVSLLYEAGTDAINLLVETTTDSGTDSRTDRPSVTVAGQLFTEQPLDPSKSVAMLTPVDMASPSIQCAIDGTGNFTFQQLSPGDYQLRVKTAEQQIVVPLVQM